MDDDAPPPPDRSQYREVFEAVYAGPAWGGTSGPGSSPVATLEYRQFLERFIARNNIRSVVDIGCGDWQFSRYIHFGKASYLGVDVVPHLIERNQAAYGGEKVRFELAPEDPATLPQADLLLMKDVLQHLPDAEILHYRRHVVPRYRFALLTNSISKVQMRPRHNTDIAPGRFRTVDLRAAPYRFKGAYVSEYWTDAWERIQTLLVIN
ncbi:class I SAM-dependent methyltransferase [Roseomonas sp. GC11]|uniref:class I SAM-dependent methyltransferase n=1 Tax=Roseomonas sp. GC11 TaxID=2950546 RepID=UPI00210B5341|nr:class I SAM-dependent methyltransferase [Roseomonas sp. GC11]MCQ4162764.1 class I SAM-dependent methyltransferase [Roseomonas sp. GC11]